MFNAGDTIDGHTICLKALVGSHNYNLNTSESDRDYKYFVWPTFNDLYDNKMYRKEVVTDAEDYTIHDIRKLPMLLWKANLNFIEILYSKELTGDSDLLEYLEENKEELATMNLPGLYMAAMGMSLEKEKLMTKDSPARHDAIEKYGYDPKSACHALRVVDFLRKYHVFRDMSDAFWYPTGSLDYTGIMDIKQGKLSLQDFKDCLYDIRETAKSFKYNFSAPRDELAYNDFCIVLKQKVRQRLC